MSTVRAAFSPWYCQALRRASSWLADAARYLESASIDGAAPPAADVRAALEALRQGEIAEESLRELRLRSLRYY